MDNPIRVAIIGGGIAGLSAAHELSMFEGFEVHVYEKTDSFGGKAKSQDLREHFGAEPDEEKKAYLGEHGFRIFPHFYRHIVQTMKEIPYLEEDAKNYGRKNALDNNVWGNVRGSSEGAYANGSLHIIPRPFPSNPIDFLRAVRELLDDDAPIKDADVLVYSWYLLKFLSSCEERRDGEYDRMTWAEYAGIGKGVYSKAYERLMASVPRSLSAMWADKCSARTLGNTLLQVLFDFRGNSGLSSEAVLTGPTSETWLETWRKYLEKGTCSETAEECAVPVDDQVLEALPELGRDERSAIATQKETKSRDRPPPSSSGAALQKRRRKVKFTSNHELKKIKFNGKIVTEVHLCHSKKTDCKPDDKAASDLILRPRSNRNDKTGFDYFIFAVPLEVMQKVLADSEPTPPADSEPTPPATRLLGFDPSLKMLCNIGEDGVVPMVGIQYYLSEDLPICHGHVFYPDSEWALTTVSQRQFWEPQLKEEEPQLKKEEPQLKCGWDQYISTLDIPDIQHDKKTKQKGIQGILSVVISDWDSPSKYLKKPAKDCSEQELKREVWRQLQNGLREGSVVLSDEHLWVNPKLKIELQPKWGDFPDTPPYDPTMREDWLQDVLKYAAHADDNLLWEDPKTKAKLNDKIVSTPLLIHPRNSQARRPDAQLRIPNLLLAADYVKTFTDVASMEAANEAAKRAVLAILRRERITPVESYPELFPLCEGSLFAAAKAFDRMLYLNGKQPHIMDAPEILSTLGGSVFGEVFQTGMSLLGLRSQSAAPPPAIAARVQRGGESFFKLAFTALSTLKIAADSFR